MRSLALKRFLRLPSRFTAPKTKTLANSLSTSSSSSRKSSSSPRTGDDEWNDAWEFAWLPNDDWSHDHANVTLPSGASAADASSSLADVSSPSSAAAEMDADTKAFVAEMDERWNERRAAKKLESSRAGEGEKDRGQKKKKEMDEYRVRKQRIHAGLWMKEIEKMEEAKVGGSAGGGDDIDRLLDSCSEIFDSGNIDLSDPKIQNTSEFKSKPDGWESTTKTQDGNIWEISQREEDILLQEFERRIAFSKFQIASFIKSHIFSRRRPVDGWKYMIEEIGPNAKRGKGNVQRLPSLADPSTQPFKESPALGPDLRTFRGR